MSEFIKTRYDFTRDEHGRPTMDQIEQYEGYGYIVDVVTPYQHETPYVTIYIDDKKNPSPYKPYIHAEIHQDGSVNVSLDTSMLANTAITVKEAVQMHKEFTEAIKAARDLKTTVLMKVPA